MSSGRMPLTSHRKGSRDGGSAQSSPVRSPDNLTQETGHQPVRGSNPSQMSLDTNTKSHVSVSTSNSQNCGEEKIASVRNVSSIPSVAWETQSHGERATPSVSHTYHHRSHLHHQHHGFGWGEKDKVVLLVDGKRFNINPNFLVKHPNTMLGRFVAVAVCVCVCVCVCGERERERKGMWLHIRVGKLNPQFIFTTFGDEEIHLNSDNKL